MVQLVSTGQLTINDYNDGMTVYLSNEGMSLPADDTGVVTDYTGASTTFFVYLGQVDDSGSWTVTAAPSTGVDGSFGTGIAIRTYTVSSLVVDSAYVDFTATKPGFLNVGRRFSISRARKGVDGTPGEPGFPGTDGTSSRRAYCGSATATTSTAPASTTGFNSFPGANQGGIIGTWSLTTPSLAAGQFLYVSDGTYSPITGQITWGVPYWNSLRVGDLETVNHNTGSLNVSGDVTTTNGYISLKADGTATFKSLIITGAGDNPILSPGASTINLGGLPDAAKNSSIKLGGRNFVLDSQHLTVNPNDTGYGTSVLMTDETTPYYRTTATVNVSTYGNQYLFPKIPVGTVCVISCDVRISSAGSVGFYGGQGMQAVPANMWTRISFIFTQNGSSRQTGNYYSGLVLDYRNYKVEIGNIATDWTPAPEDVDAGIATAGTTSTWAGTTGSGKPSDNATSNISLAGRNCTISGNTATATGVGGNWISEATSTNGFAGGAFVSAIPLPGDVMFGLNSDPLTDTSYSSLDYAIYINGSDVRVYQSGVDNGTTYTTFVAGVDTLSVTYDGSRVRYAKNGTTFYEKPAFPSTPLYFDSSFNSAGGALKNISFGPMSNTYSAPGKGAALNSDPACAAPSEWNQSNTIFATVTDGAYGNTVVRSSTTAFLSAGSTKPFPMVAGRTYRASTLIRSPSGQNMSAYFRAARQSASGGLIAYNLNYEGARISSTTWVKWENTFVAEAGTIQGYVEYDMHWDPAQNGYYLEMQNIRIEDITEGATFGLNVKGQITGGNVATFIAPNAVGNAQFGGDLFSSNWNGLVQTGGAGWYLERSSGNFYGNNLITRGSIYGGAYTNAYSWPNAGAGGGFFLGSSGLLLGSANDGKYLQVTSDGNIYAPGFTIENGSSYFRGTLQVGAVSASPLSSLNTSIGATPLRERTGGGRTEIAGDIIRVYDGNGSLRVRIGNLGL